MGNENLHYHNNGGYNQLENMEPEMAIEKLQLYLQELFAQKNDAVKRGYYEKATTIRDEEKRIEALIASKAGKTENCQVCQPLNLKTAIILQLTH
jgi:UvrB/uvrC motif.